MRKYITSVAIILLLAILGFVGYKFFSQSKSAAKPPFEINFSEIGNLAFNAPGLNANTWYLVYEKPGQPTNAALLKFDEQSLCLDGQCPGAIQTGERVKVDGIATTSVVLVRSLSTDISEGQNDSIALYLYNPLNDLISGTRNIACSANGLQPVSRIIPETGNEIGDIEAAINLLLQGQISPDEKTQGLNTWFPLPGVKLTGASLNNGVLTLTFDDPLHNTGGGSCRVSVMWGEIEATAKQFSGVSQVKFQPDTLFQP